MASRGILIRKRSLTLPMIRKQLQGENNESALV